MMTKIRDRRKNKKAMSLLEIMIVIFLIAIIVAAAFKYLNGKKEEVMYKNTLSTFLQSFHEGMINYSINSTLTTDNFASASATNVASFMNVNVVALSGTYLTPTSGTLKDLVKVTVNPARDANANNNRRYKAMFDLTGLSSANSWTADQRNKAENEIAKFFSNVTPDGLIVAGTATSLPAATTDATASNPDNDGIIIIDRVK